MASSAHFQPNYKEAEAIYARRRPLDARGQPLSFFTEFKGLLQLGRRSMLYLYWIQLTFLFMLVVSLIEIAHTYYFYQQDTTNNIFWRLSMANWDPMSTESGAVTSVVVLAILEGVLLIVVITYIRGFHMFRRRVNNASSHTFISVSDFSVHVRNVPKDEVRHGTRRLFRFFSQFGDVVNIAMALDSGNVNRLKKLREELSQDITHCRVKLLHHPLLSWYYRLRLLINTFRYNRIQKEIDTKLAQTTFKCTGDVFVTFDTERARFACLHLYNRPYLVRCCSQVKFGGKNDHKRVVFRVENSKEPGDIIWEHLEYSTVSKYLRRTVSLIVSLVAMAATIVASFFLAREQYSLTTANLSNIGSIVTNAGLAEQTGASVAISIVLNVILYIMTYFMFYLTNFEKHRFKSHAYVSQLSKLAIALCLTQIFVMGPIYAPATSLTGKIKVFNTAVPPLEEESQYYYTLTIMFVAATLFNIVSEAIQLPWTRLVRYVKAQFAVTQDELNRAYIPPKYEYPYRYAYQLKLVMLGIAFSGLFPLGIYITTIGLLLSYPIDKFNIIKVYAKVGKDEDYLSESAVGCISLAWLLRYVLMAIRVYYFASSSPPLQISNPFLISYILCCALYAAFLIFQYILRSGTSVFVHLFCCSRYRFPNYITGKKGTTSIMNFPNLTRYKPPVSVDELVEAQLKNIRVLKDVV